MPLSMQILVGVAMLAMANGQAVVLSAKGDSGTSLGLLVDPTNQNDANFISNAEITANVVNECGRTLAAGNIDIGENTENALAAGNVTKVTKGSKVQITVDQRNANGTGPFTCDMDQTSNANGATGQTPLDTQQGTAKSATGQVTLTVTMPSDMACTGASTGNVCTVRCRNAQDFGGCVAVQQTDVTPSQNDPANITTAQTLEGILAQVQQNKVDLPAAIQGNQAATKVNDQGVDIAQAILNSDPTIVQDVQKELQTNTVSAAAATTTAPTANTNTGNGKKGKGNGNAATGNAATGNAATGNAATGNAAKGNGNAAKGNGNAATGNANAATAGNAKGNANAATAQNKGNNNNNNNNNNKRESLAERRKRYVNAGVDFDETAGN